MNMVRIKKAGKAPAKSRKNDPVSVAQTAVSEFETMAKDYESAKEEFENRFPEAAEELSRLEEFRGNIEEHIKKTKVLVAAAKQTIGPFKVAIKHSKPGYKGEAMVEVLVTLDDASLGETFRLMQQAGLVSSLQLDKDVLKVYFAHNPEMAELFEPAYDEGGEELTPAVTVPKIS